MSDEQRPPAIIRDVPVPVGTATEAFGPSPRHLSACPARLRPVPHQGRPSVRFWESFALVRLCPAVRNSTSARIVDADRRGTINKYQIEGDGPSCQIDRQGRVAPTRIGHACPTRQTRQHLSTTEAPEACAEAWNQGRVEICLRANRKRYVEDRTRRSRRRPLCIGDEVCSST